MTDEGSIDVTSEDLKQILDAIEAGRISAKEAEVRLAELIQNRRQHEVVAMDTMLADGKESKGILHWLKSWAQRLHK